MSSTSTAPAPARRRQHDLIAELAAATRRSSCRSRAASAPPTRSRRLLDAGVARVVIGSLARRRSPDAVRGDARRASGRTASPSRSTSGSRTACRWSRPPAGPSDSGPHAWGGAAALSRGAPPAGHRHRPRRDAERPQFRADGSAVARLPAHRAPGVGRRRGARRSCRAACTGAAGAIVGKALWEGRFDLAEALAQCPRLGSSPASTSRDGRVVKGVRFRDHRDVGDIVDHALRYRDEGADELVFYDITASAEGRSLDLAWVERVARGDRHSVRRRRRHPRAATRRARLPRRGRRQGLRSTRPRSRGPTLIARARARLRQPVRRARHRQLRGDDGDVCGQAIYRPPEATRDTGRARSTGCARRRRAAPARSCSTA